MRRIVFTNDKGGVGKTTTVANLSVGLSRKGIKTLVVDLDPQADVTFALLTQRAPETKNGILPPTAYTALMGYHTIDQVILPAPNYSDLSLIPSNADLADAALRLAHRPSRLRRILNDFPDNKFDIVLIDTGKGLDPLVINALVAANEVIVMVTPGKLELDAIDRMKENVSLVRNEVLTQSKEPVIRGILLTLADPYSVTKDTIDRIEQAYPGLLFKTIIPKNNDLQKAIARARSIFEIAPKSKGAKAYQQLIEELQL